MSAPARELALSRVTPALADYQNAYRHVRLERTENGVLTMTLHTDGDSLVWSASAHEELAYCFGDVAADRDNAVVIMTGAGDAWCAEIDLRSFRLRTARDWDGVVFEGRKLLMSLMEIEVPVIAAVNGPARMHPEIPVLSDVVVAAESATFQDAPHFPMGVVPGDGSHLVWPHVLGPNRGRYFLLTGQELDVRTAADFGVVNEVVPTGTALSRAREIVDVIAAKPYLARRYARMILTQPIKALLLDGLGHGLLGEALAGIDMTQSR